MARKHVTKPIAVFNDTDISINQTSTTVNVENLDKGSVLMEWTGTAPVGVVTVEARNRRDDETQSEWETLNFGSNIDITGNSGSHQIIFNELPFTEIRLQYTSTSGTGTMNAVTLFKTVGA